MNDNKNIDFPISIDIPRNVREFKKMDLIRHSMNVDSDVARFEKKKWTKTCLFF